MFKESFVNVTIQEVGAPKRGTCLEASMDNGTKILMDFCGLNPALVPDGTNAYFFGNKLILVTRWSDMSDEEKDTVENGDLAIALHPCECVQISIKVGNNWGDVIVTLPHCYADLNDENAPVEELIFIFADTHDSDYITCRSVNLPPFIRNYLCKCNQSSHSYIALDEKVEELRLSAEADEMKDFWDYLYDECWNRTRSFFKTARNNEPDNIPDGIYLEIDGDNNITNMYQHEYVPPVRMSDEVKLYLDLAQKGYAEAQYNMGVCYEQGDGVDQNFEQAVYWYRKAADQGYAGAQYNLGVCYYNGYGVEADNSEAVKLFSLAANQNHAGAAFNMGVCYYNGIGVQRDIMMATQWLRKAASLGHPEAKRILGI